MERIREEILVRDSDGNERTLTKFTKQRRYDQMSGLSAPTRTTAELFDEHDRDVNDNQDGTYTGVLTGERFTSI